MCADVPEFVQLCAGVRESVWVCACVCVCVQREFSEFLLENRVLISVDFNMHPIRIFRL